MNEYDVRRLALVLAIQAEIEAAKLDNEVRIKNGTYVYADGSAQTPELNYPSQWFDNKAEELRILAYKHNEQL
jgi:hypothetical protein